MTDDVICSLEGYMRSLGLDHQTLAGIPAWMAAVGVVAVIVFSHLFVNARQKLPTVRRYARFNLFSLPLLKKWVRRPYFPILMQSVSLSLFLLILTAGLFGNSQYNIAPVLTWTWWWALLIFLVLGLGQTFCMICPWEALSSLVTSLSLKSRIKKLGFERPWPKWGRYMYPAIALFVVLTWFELGNDVTHSASMTAMMALFMAGAAILTAMIFEKRAFCRNACLVGRITGLYSLFSPVELRPQSQDVCLKCVTKDCHRGNEHATGCPTNLFPGHLKENTYCTLCTECVRACPHDNLALNVRAPATDLLHKDRFQWDEAILAVVLLALTSFHGFTMTPLWTRLNQVLRVETGWGPTTLFTVLMLAMLIAPMFLFWIAANAASRLARIQAASRAPAGLQGEPSRATGLQLQSIDALSRNVAVGGAVAEQRPRGQGKYAWIDQVAGWLSRSWTSLLARNQRMDFAVTTGWFGWHQHPSVYSDDASVAPAKVFKAFAYALIPVALFYHLAHNCMHFFLEAGRLIPLLSDPFGWGWNLFGTAGKTYGPLFSLQTIWCLQVLCIVTGHVYGVLIADRVAKRLFEHPRQVALALVPLLCTMICYSSFSIWLIAQPMDMRTAM